MERYYNNAFCCCAARLRQGKATALRHMHGMPLARNYLNARVCMPAYWSHGRVAELE